jgi:hypothetical protein
VKSRTSEAVLGEDAHHPGTAIELGIDPLNRVRRGDRSPVLPGEGEAGKHVGLGGADLLSNARETWLEDAKGV